MLEVQLWWNEIFSLRIPPMIAISLEENPSIDIKLFAKVQYEPFHPYFRLLDKADYGLED